ncbi:MAG: hypothetical protein JRF33_16865 [Deltaproteobacteria bacterium]|nr:hypothetical protein [Deltaproteobacteria bacterium]
MMKKIGLLGLTLAIGLSFAFQARADDKKVIAIGEAKTINCGGNRYFRDQRAAAVASNLRSRIAATRVFTVVSRTVMGKILQEHKMVMVGLADSATVKELGQLLQADYLLGLEVTCMDTITFNVNLWDVETGATSFTKVYEMKDGKKVSRAVKDIAKVIKDFGKSGRWPGGPGKSETMMMIDSKAFHDSAEYIIRQIRHQVPKFQAKVEEVNAYSDTITLKVSYGARKAWPGLKLKVERDGEEIGWMYLKEKPKGKRSVKAGTTGEISAFEEGDVASCVDWEPVIAIGHIDDEDLDNEDLVDMFREEMNKEFEQADGVAPAEGKKIDRILQRMGTKTKKKDLAKLHKAGVDLLIVGRFSGETGKRRVDFDVLNTVDGKRVIKIKRDGIGL